MDIVQFIAQFFYRIRYWLLWGGFIVTVLVAYFTQFLPFSYTVNSNIYAGVDIAVYSIAEWQELGEVRHQHGDDESAPQQPVTDAVKELGYKLYYIHKTLFPFDYFYVGQHLE